MKFSRGLFSLIPLIIFTNIVCAESAITTNNKDIKETKIEFTDPNRPITVEKSQPTFKIRLASNITTGYAWFLQSPYNSNIVATSHVYQKPGKTMPGAPGYEEWEFKILPPGFEVPQTMNLTFSYARPWELEEAKHVIMKIFTH
jgi:predicted secreted protein